MSPPQKTGLFLTGGGARAAYQVGVLQAIFSLLSETDWPAKKIPLILSAVRRQAPLMRRPLRVALIILKKASRTCWAFGARSKLSRSTALTPWA